MVVLSTIFPERVLASWFTLGSYERSRVKKMFLIDGSNHAFRVHFALPPMHASDGFPTRALYGFSTLFAKLMRTWNPDYVLVAFDNTGKTFRHELYPAYKGERPDMPGDLREQWPRFVDLVEAFGYAGHMATGVEADDVIGTLATQFAGPDVHVYLVTGDKDFCQLVNEHVTILDLMKDVEIGPEGVREKFEGVGPEHVVDVLGLAGDKSDNIPGVPGIGVKTAAKLLLQHGSLEQILEDAPKIRGKRGQNLQEFAEDARMSKVLATIRCDLELPYTLETLAPREMNVDWLRQKFDDWNFGRIAKRLLPERPPLDTSRYTTVDSLRSLMALARTLRSARRFVLGAEALTRDPRTSPIVGLSFAWGDGDAAYLPLGHEEGDQLSESEALAVLKPLLESERVEKWGHGTKDLVALLRNHGVTLRGLRGDTELLDHMLAAHARVRGLEQMATRYLGHTMNLYDDLSDSAERTFHECDTEEGTEYAAEIAHVGYLLHSKLEPKLSEGMERLYREIELPLVPVLADMQRTGIRLDVEALAGVRADIHERLEAAAASCHAIVGREFNVGSVTDLREILFEELGYEPIKKTRTGWSTDASVLEKLAGQREPDLPSAILEYRRLQKLESTYLDRLPEYVAEDGRIHCRFHQVGAATGRLSSSDPNMQNIPVRRFEGRRIRECFVPADGCVFLSADYSQIELRILAHVSGSRTLIDGFARGQDIHARTAREIFGVSDSEVTLELRSAAKAINFGLIYGMSAFRLAGDLQIERDEASRYMEEYFARMPEVEGWLESTRESAREHGYVTTLFGRRRILPGLYSSMRNERMAAEREAVNTIIQGTAADLVKIAMRRVWDRLARERSAAKLLLQVHDELLLEVPVGECDRVVRLVTEEMEVALLDVPLRVNTATGHNWNEAHG